MKKEHPFVVKLRCRILKNNPKEPFMSIVNTLALERNRQIKIYLKDFVPPRKKKKLNAVNG